ncbi:MAG: hypothetical protein J6X49_13395 [Victivallales bacterium]|nr:hypothetical protein [Victivallales bacterium]
MKKRTNGTPIEEVIMNNIYKLFENSYLFIAIFGTTIFVIQFIMTLVGFGHGGEDADGDGIPDDMDGQDASDIDHIEATQSADALHVNFFSLKSIMAFLTFYGWGGVCFKQYGWGGFAIALVSGITMMVIISVLIALLLKMQQSGNISPKDYIGKSGSVYLSIPGGRAPGGKAIVKLDACTREIEALSDEPIASGQTITIVQFIGSNTYLVKTI